MSESTLSILLIDDDGVDRAAVLRALRSTRLEVTIEEVATGEAGLERLREGAFDCALLDFQLPDIDGIDVLRIARDEELPTPFVVLTRHGDEDLAVALMKAGATDYLSKSALSPERLARALRYARRVHLAEQRARDAKVALEEAIEARDTMLAVVSHDLRNPLNAFATSLALLEELLPQKEGTVRRTLDAMDRSVHQMNRLLGDLLDVARIEGGRLRVERQPVIIQELVTEVYEQFRPQARERSIELRSDVDDRCDPVYGDRWRLLQVLSNLLGNAVRVTSEGGVIRVGCESGGNGRVRLFVSDTGPGVSPEELPQLFQPFWQSPNTARGGVGLGLAIARGIVEAHGGGIHAESRLGEGSCFYIELPIERPVDE